MPQPDFEQRRKQLIAQGRLYRQGMIESREDALSNLRMDTLAKTAIAHLAANGYAALEQIFNLKNLRASHVELLLPLLTSGIPLLLRKRRLIKPALIGGAVLAVAGVAASLALRWNRTRRPAAPTEGRHGQ